MKDVLNSTSTQKEEDFSDPLLSDEEFAQLMRAEYAKLAPQTDEIRAQVVWDKTQTATSLRTGVGRASTIQSSKPWTRWMGGLIGSAVAAAALVIVIKKPEDTMREKGASAVASVSLEGVTFDSEKRQHYLGPDQPISANTPIFFQATSSSVVRGFLAVSEKGAPPTVRIPSFEISPGKSSLIRKGDDLWGYAFNVEMLPVKICLVATSNLPELQKLETDLTQVWTMIPAENCFEKK